MIVEAIYGLLAANAAVTALVADRLHYEALPAGSTLPAVTVQLQLVRHQHTMSGPAGHAFGDLRLNCFATTPIAARELAAAARNAIDGFRGEVTTAGGPVRFAFIAADDEGTIPHRIPDGQPLPDVFGVYLDAKFMTK